MNFAQGARSTRLVRYVLAEIKGIGLETADRLCHENGILPDVKMMRLSPAKIDALNQSIVKSGILTGQKLDREIRDNIDRLKSIGCYRGLRHTQRLPVRGQRTSTNAKTARKVRH